jgi:hypothetical protein
MLMSVTGCGGSAHPAPQSTAGSPITAPEPPSPTGRPRLARAGTACGQVTDLKGGRARVFVARGLTTCTEALRVFQKYYDPNTPAEGVAGLVVIGHWTCETRATVAICTYRRTVIQARG